MITDALTWVVSSIGSLVSGLNFSITLGSYSFGFLDFLVALSLLGIVVRNFVHTAR